MADVFHKFDEDKSGTLEIGELCEMFQSNGITMTKFELNELFSAVE